ncbi:casein kinase I [Apophysomyces sp. BC1034]|nr:casein kinase I [Apophysomyces sp. BC1015]KAG0178151.1 casein kinase I [Apophysomyces sp. BC1021]KAG0188356.1 casein kinase I [Apophysomyces sp. BC1034]
MTSQCSAQHDSSAPASLTSTNAIVGVHYRVGKKLGEGSFGVLYEGTNLLNSESVAIKFESRTSDVPQLKDEYRTYKILAGSPGIPTAHFFGHEKTHDIMVMDLLGPSLEDLFDLCDRKFSIETVAMIAKQMLDRMEAVHERNLIYRDIKPDNFLIGRPGTKFANTLFLIDYGMAKQYRDPQTKQHIPYRERKSLSGTARYMSISTHWGREQSRRDDLEALGYVFMYFLRGSLPWQGLKAPTNKQKYEKIGEKKQNTMVKDLCAGFPEEFGIYLQYSRNLGFNEDPNYYFLRELFNRVLCRIDGKHNDLYDWNLLNNGKGWEAFPAEEELEKQVFAHSAAIDTAMKSSHKDMDKLTKYLHQRIELEEGYQNTLAGIILDLKAPDKDATHTKGIQKSVNDYVHMSDALQTARTEFVQTMKFQLKTLARLKEYQDRLRRQHKKNMLNIGTQYLQMRTQALPAAREAYTQKWEEIDKSQLNNAHVTSPTSPSTPLPRMNRSTSITTTTMTTRPEDNTRGTFSMDDDRAPTASLSMAASVLQTKAPEVAPQSPHRRIERFMNKFSYLAHHNDHSRHNVRIAKLKVEAHEADVEYRKVVRRLDLLSKKHKAANEYSFNALQSQLLEKSSVMKEALNVVLSAELKHIKHTQEAIQTMQVNISVVNPDEERKAFDETLHVKQFPEMVPIYYIHHQLGKCKDLIFGMSLSEYAQRYGRSPPLIVTKCIEAIEHLGGLEREGIYRISGKQSSVETIKRSFERDEESFVFGQNDAPEDVFSIASTLKVYLRELETPLFPFKLADRVTYSQTDKELRLMNLLTRILKLPYGNYETLKALVEHLVKLGTFVDKNKMSIKNLSLIFTPAIFQDLNQAQRSPGEWFEDCVLEDLLLNHGTLFADKDLHGASAITGKIDYGFEQVHDDELNLSSPEFDFSPTESEEDNNNQSATTLTENTRPTAISTEDLTTHSISPAAQVPLTIPLANSTSVTKEPNLPSQPRPSGTDRQKKFRTVSQDRGLKVDTRISQPQTNNLFGDGSTKGVLSESPTEAEENHKAPPVAMSATVSSFGFLSQGPEVVPPADNYASPLRRSSTTGKRAVTKRKPGDKSARPPN